MYLSRVKIDANNRKKLKELNHLGAYHSWVEDSFPEEREKPKNERTRKLWRVDELRDEYYLIVLSENKPDFEKLEKYGVKNTAESKSYDRLLDSIKPGMRARFKIELNTVYSTAKNLEKGKRGRVVPVSHEKLGEFFLDRTEKNGFSVNKNELAITNIGKKLFLRKKEEKGARVNLVSATFEGILNVTDEGKFRETLVIGIGRKKAYGFGLLTIIPCNE